MNHETKNYGGAETNTSLLVDVATFPIIGTEMKWVAVSNSLEILEDGALSRTYDTGSLLKISINASDEYEIIDPGTAIEDYNFNKRLSLENIRCFSIASRTGIGVMDFRDFRIKNIWNLDSCAIGISLGTDAILVGFSSDTLPCFTEINDPDATCTH
ncbi:MAG TPA: hypothetical protein ENJ82_13255 [Bacteroidetes bacterium]|nr:hypothetical protein [Bacteroidota bacterium]